MEVRDATVPAAGEHEGPLVLGPPRRGEVPPSRARQWRASDRDREQTVERLRQAAGEGRLRPDELERRLDDALSASTYGELDAIVSDLPGPRSQTSRRLSTRARARPFPAVSFALASSLAVALVLLVLMAAGLTLVRHSSLAAPNQFAQPGPALDHPHHR
jgi:hypothetical protein